MASGSDTSTVRVRLMAQGNKHQCGGTLDGEEGAFCPAVRHLIYSAL